MNAESRIEKDFQLPEPGTACVIGVGQVGLQVINLLRQSS
jgi:hypothetical protein